MVLFLNSGSCTETPFYFPSPELKDRYSFGEKFLSFLRRCLPRWTRSESDRPFSVPFFAFVRGVGSWLSRFSDLVVTGECFCFPLGRFAR